MISDVLRCPGTTDGMHRWNLFAPESDPCKCGVCGKAACDLVDAALRQFPAEPAPPTATPPCECHGEIDHPDCPYHGTAKARGMEPTPTLRVSPLIDDETVRNECASIDESDWTPNEAVWLDLRDARAQLAEADAQFLRTVAGYKRRKEAAEAQLAEAQRERDALKEVRQSLGDHMVAADLIVTETIDAAIAATQRAEAAERREQALREQCAKWADVLAALLESVCHDAIVGDGEGWANPDAEDLRKHIPQIIAALRLADAVLENDDETSGLFAFIAREEAAYRAAREAAK